jgi:hypothetical protein
MAERIDIIVSVDTSRPGGAQGTAQALRAAGVEISDVLEDIGTITGSCSEDQLPAIERTPGVIGVERSRAVSIPRPGTRA